MRAWIALAVLAFAVIFTAPLSSAQSCVSSSRDYGQSVGYDSVQLVPNNIPSSLMQEFHNAYGEWNKPTCNTNGDSFPSFQTVGGAGRVVSVNYYSGLNPRNRSSCGNFVGNTINLYGRIEVNGQRLSCTNNGNFQDTLSHELGHLLGLQDSTSSCSSHIMAPRTQNPNGSFKDRQVQPSECSTVAQTNQTPSENDGPVCAQPLSFGASSSWRVVAPVLIPCEDDGEGGGSGGGSFPPDSNTGSPILIDLDRGGFQLTDLEHGVRFDLDNDGTEEQVSWTRSNSQDGWLALDRNGNGWIDSGAELFGNYTLQPPHEEPHGYRALEVFDQEAMGGDGNGVISGGDLIFHHLVIWTDINHNGLSEIGELRSLTEAGVLWIGLSPLESRRVDRHGNEFRYLGQVGTTRRRVRSVDVFLLTGP